MNPHHSKPYNPNIADVFIVPVILKTGGAALKKFVTLVGSLEPICLDTRFLETGYEFSLKP